LRGIAATPQGLGGLHVLLHGGVLALQPIDFIDENWSDFHHNPQVRGLKRAAGEFGAG